MKKEFIYMLLIVPMIYILPIYASVSEQLGEAGSFLSLSQSPDIMVSDFDVARDKEGVGKLFENNWGFLEGSDTSNIEKFKSSLQRPEKLSFENVSNCHLKVLHLEQIKHCNDKQSTTKVRKDRDANKLVGFIFYSMGGNNQRSFMQRLMGTDNKRPIIQRLAINEKFRKRGYATCLLNYAINDLKKMGASRIAIGSFTENTSAIKLYKEVGFRPIQPSSYCKPTYYTWLEKLVVPQESGIIKKPIKNFIEKMIKWSAVLGVGTIALLYLVKKYYRGGLMDQLWLINLS